MKRLMVMAALAMVAAASHGDEAVGRVALNAPQEMNRGGLRASRPTSARVPPAAKRVVLVGVDGMGSRWIPWDKMPNLAKLRDDGLYAVGRCHRPTASAINWKSVFSGLPPEIHGYSKWNSEKPNLAPPASVLDADGRLPDVFTEIRRQDPDARTVSLYTWPGIAFCHEGDSASYSKRFDVEAVNAEALKQVATEPKFMFYYWGYVDTMGHKHGWGSTNQVAACETLDADLGRLFDALKASPGWDETAIIFVADHGGLDKGHGGKEDLRVFDVPFIVGGPAAKGLKVREPIMLEDVTPTILALLGYEVPDVMRGRPALCAERCADGE